MGNPEYVEQSVTDSQQWVIILHGGWTKNLKYFAANIASYEMLHRASWTWTNSVENFHKILLLELEIR